MQPGEGPRDGAPPVAPSLKYLVPEAEQQEEQLEGQGHMTTGPGPAAQEGSDARAGAEHGQDHKETSSSNGSSVVDMADGMVVAMRTWSQHQARSNR